MSFLVGLDLGQARDYSAVAVLEQSEGGGELRYDVRHLHRWPLGTGYPAVADDVAAMLRRSPLWEYAPVIVDITGVGAPVADMLRRARLAPVGMRIHGGANVTRADDQYNVPKKDLAAVLAVLLQSGRLRIAPALPHAQTLLSELLAFRAKITPAGSATYESWRERDHDDLVLAVAVAVWYGEHLAGIPVFREFSTALHVASERVEPRPGAPIIRGWRTAEPPCCVWFQVDDRRRCRVLLEEDPESGRGVRDLKASVLQASNILFPRFEFLDYGEVEGTEAGGKTLADILQPEVQLLAGEMSLGARLEVARDWLSRMKQGESAVVIDPHCDHLIRALAGGYVFRRTAGRESGGPEENAHAYIVDAWLVAFGHPAATLTPAQRARLAGPRDFGPPL